MRGEVIRRPGHRAKNAAFAYMGDMRSTPAFDFAARTLLGVR